MSATSSPVGAHTARRQRAHEPTAANRTTSCPTRSKPATRSAVCASRPPANGSTIGYFRWATTAILIARPLSAMTKSGSMTTRQSLNTRCWVVTFQRLARKMKDCRVTKRRTRFVVAVIVERYQPALRKRFPNPASARLSTRVLSGPTNIASSELAGSPGSGRVPGCNMLSRPCVLKGCLPFEPKSSWPLGAGTL